MDQECYDCRTNGERIEALEQRVAALEQQTPTDIDTLGQWDMDAAAVEAMDAAVYDAHHVEWELERERNDLRDEVKRLRSALREISTLEGADPDGIVWTWKQLFCKAEDVAKQALEVDG